MECTELIHAVAGCRFEGRFPSGKIDSNSDEMNAPATQDKQYDGNSWNLSLLS